MLTIIIAAHLGGTIGFATAMFMSESRNTGWLDWAVTLLWPAISIYLLITLSLDKLHYLRESRRIQKLIREAK